ncbi:hypothetical protein [Saccharopolyspora griseoalba]|uniref:Uncharacterized protein n=1 Tax=Saccharopolyspora griseoalba TaxID=1431848 RepID=A0ABW2LKI2_9PSEU
MERLRALAKRARDAFARRLPDSNQHEGSGERDPLLHTGPRIPPG